MKKFIFLFLTILSFRFTYSTIKVISFDVGDTLIKMNTILIPPLLYTRLAFEISDQKIDFLNSVKIIKEILNYNPLIGKAIALRNQPNELQKLSPQLTKLFKENWANKIGFPIEKVQEMIDRSFKKIIKNKHLTHKIYDDSKPTLDNFKKLNFPMIVISNWTSDLPNLLQSFNLHDYFDVIIASDKVGFVKPKKEIFEIALKTFNLKRPDLKIQPHEVLHVGDSANCDISGAKNAGFHEVLINRKATHPNNQIVIASLKDIPHVINYIHSIE